MTYSISKDILQSQCGLGYSFRRPLVRSLARNFNRIKVAFQGLGGGEALLNRQIVTFSGAVDITEHVRLCLDFSIHSVEFDDRIPGLDDSSLLTPLDVRAWLPPRLIPNCMSEGDV